jgi:predicted permease
MNRLRVFVSRLLVFFHKRRPDENLDAELRAHLQLLTEENLRRGMTPEEARYAARREFGGIEQTMEHYREQRGLPFLDTLAQDVRLGLRGFVKRPGFACLAILTLALGIGVNTSLFTIVHGVLFSPLPFREPDRLVSLWERIVVEGNDSPHNVVSGGVFQAWQRQATSFEQLALIGEDSANLSGDGGSLPEAIGTRYCSFNLFPMLGVQPIHGRPFSAEDDRPNANATVLLTYGLWKRRYGGEPAAVGKTILLNAKPYTVIGVLPSWLDYPDTRVQVWLPVRHEISASDLDSRSSHRFFVTARLKPGVSRAQAYSELEGIQERMHEQFPGELMGKGANVVPLSEDFVRDVKTSLCVLMGAVGCVLLITCLNIANLFVARGAARRKETAVRAALGGSRWRLMREQLTESLLLTFAGGALGALLAYASIQWLVALRENLPRANSIHVDQAALLFTVAITVLSGVFAGLLPALSATRHGFLEPLKENSRAVGGGQARAGLRKLLLMAEMALTVVLLIGAGLLLKSFAELRSVNMGCATNNVLTMSLTLPEAKYKEFWKIAQFFDNLLAQVRAIPGVSAAGFVTVVPGGGHFEDNTFTIEGRPPLATGQFQDATVLGADPGYLRVMDIPLLRGRYYTDADRRENLNAVIVSESMAKHFFPGDDPLGKRVVMDWQGKPRFEVVGVVADVISNLDGPPEPTIYFPLNSGRFNSGGLVVRSTREVTSLALPIQKAIAGMDKDLPVSDVLTMEQVIGKSTVNSRFDAVLVLLFAVLALILAAVGLYGLLSYLVTQRTSEIGLRLALGAQRSAVMRLMLADGLRPTLIGLAIGLAGGAVAARLIRSVLFGTHPIDATVFAGVGLVVVVVAVVASMLPAWRASRFDPMAALRCE